MVEHLNPKPGSGVIAVRTAVGLHVRDDRAFTLFDGPDAARFLQGMVTNDVSAVAVGDATYALLLTPKARILCDLRLTRLAESTFLADHAVDAGALLRSTLRRYRLRSRTTIDDADAGYAVAIVAGARAGMLLLDAFGVIPRADAAENTGTAILVDGVEVHLLASPCCGEKAFELIGPIAAVSAAADQLALGLPKHNGSWFTFDELDTLRVEAGVPSFGAEIDERVSPSEVGLVERAVSFTKGCYTGQEPVARLHYRGHANRGLRSLLLDDVAPRPGATISLGEREVGRVTSARWSPTLGRVVALAIVRTEVELGATVTVDVAGAGIVAAVPAYDWKMRPARIERATPGSASQCSIP